MSWGRFVPVPLNDREQPKPANDFWLSRRYQAIVSDDYALRDGCETHSRRAA
jgi:hypothetical protein